MSVAQIEQLLSELAETHGVVLRPHICEPWLVHPFSTTPMAHWVEGLENNWWTPCIWCAFGVSTLVGGETRIHSRIGAESEPLVIRVVNGQPVGLEDMWIHFAIPPARAWQNVHQHCAMDLPICLSARGKTSWLGAIGTGYHMERTFLCSRSRDWRNPDMARTPTRTGTSGVSPKRRRSSGARDSFHPFGSLVRGIVSIRCGRDVSCPAGDL